MPKRKKPVTKRELALWEITNKNSNDDFSDSIAEIAEKTKNLFYKNFSHSFMNNLALYKSSSAFSFVIGIDIS